ncbi:DUF397 domain-containing protein [Streptomyces mobaraensis NBRC 13819 = DSM 40847]|uniref:DUF397 domain-containing protein n=2 Tax=Streptomyces mobaraensis TaxID=35621 RepID=A0A5N5W643_STRMB|nr:MULTISPECIES: DUF397 domain-containing protein [Streptomyces]EMF00712.1 hypothetical protein H340_10155 [Streptomyces mobaraensis NBRC 13819 = DSM 40847]KAB7839992.1 DUF397 domain-containing protein [Streptomyces mobaraensis]MBC2874338.1 DUF397 domain-containing protein [Streptomyces sp. TYQ1024]QTT72558.1 DUF397 domain-containing protein [Streptomyces mobaraensis NBRC 13819 = DSM 40847]UBI40371.1 DUF397 domain-containing protein [Streptomyces mobaraensis]
MAKSATEHLADDRRQRLDLANATWQSGVPGTGDVQIGFIDGYVALRDRRTPDVPAVIFSPEEWRAFVDLAREGEFDLT